MDPVKRKCACIIGARRNSQRLPGKNRRTVAGVPLYERALQTALGAGVFSSVVFTTDDEDILSGLEGREGVLLDERPASLAGSETGMWDVLRHVLNVFSGPLAEVDSLCLITPCQPFRSAAMLREAYGLLCEPGTLSVVSVTPFPCAPELALSLEQGWVRRDWNGLARSGDLPQRYYPNGLFSFVDRDAFLETGHVYTQRTVPFVTHWPESLDIDEAEDLALAERLAPCFEGAPSNPNRRG